MTHRHTEESRVNMEAEIGHKLKNARSYQRLEGAKKDSSLEPMEGVQPCRQLDFVDSRTVKEHIFFVLSQQV